MLLDPAVRAPIATSLGAIGGALSRYYITLFSLRFGTDFPYGTYFVNLTGCLLIGFFMTLTGDRLPNLAPDVKLLIVTGFLGAYTTFSTYGWESLNLIKSSGWLYASVYWLGSAVLGLVCVQLGIFLAHLGS
jgi:CrcB protein